MEEESATGEILPSIWKTSPDYARSDLNLTYDKFLEVTNVLLERPDLNSSHLFRADILYDSAGILQTTDEKENHHGIFRDVAQKHDYCDFIGTNTSVPRFRGYTVVRTVVRRLIPRKPQLDKPLVQSCFIFGSASMLADPTSKHLVIYLPRLEPAENVPWYHPDVRGLAFLFEENKSTSRLSVYYKPQADHPLEPSLRLHRTMLSLLQTPLRLAKLDTPVKSITKSDTDRISARLTTPAALKDSVIPQHLVQNTYTRLKQTYASDLISRWVEKTEPAKHVFEDLSIAAFLIELWKQMYNKERFPGFVDLACGNGVLVYILLKEGYRGYGYDARQRKTWQILDLDEKLEEKLCIPRPFLDLGLPSTLLLNSVTHDGIFPPKTFIISNHADELTPWTPLLAFLSDPISPLPFLAIPCCSHALSGALYRYAIGDIDTMVGVDSEIKTKDIDPQPSSGDLRVLRVQKSSAPELSQYACLTKKVVALAEELGYETEMTLMRIPSTRNIGIVGNRKKAARGPMMSEPKDAAHKTPADQERFEQLLNRECRKAGGLHAAAETWVQRAEKLHAGVGSGKTNHGSKGTTTADVGHS